MGEKDKNLACDPMDGGCRALAKAVGDLRNEKAGKKWVDEQMKDARMEREKILDKLDGLKWWLISTCVTAMLAIIIMLGRFILSQLGTI